MDEFAKSSLRQCRTCLSDILSVQNRCCLEECLWFKDRQFIIRSLASDAENCWKEAPVTVEESESDQENCFPASRHHFISSNCMAFATLPELLDFRMSPIGERRVISRVGIRCKSVFGPLVAPLIVTASTSSQPSALENNDFMIFDEKIGSVTPYLESDSDCNWMKFVPLLSNVEEANLMAFVYDKRIYFVTLRHIQIGEDLRVAFPENRLDGFTQVSVDDHNVSQSGECEGKSLLLTSKRANRSSRGKRRGCEKADVDVGDVTTTFPADIAQLPKRRRTAFTCQPRRSSGRLSSYLAHPVVTYTPKSVATEAKSDLYGDPLADLDLHSQTAPDVDNADVDLGESEDFSNSAALEPMLVDVPESDILSPPESSVRVESVERMSENPQPVHPSLRTGRSRFRICKYCREFKVKNYDTMKKHHLSCPMALNPSSNANENDNEPESNSSQSQTQTASGKKPYIRMCPGCGDFRTQDSKVFKQHLKVCPLVGAKQPKSKLAFPCFYCQQVVFFREAEAHFEQNHKVAGFYDCPHRGCMSRFETYRKIRQHFYIHKETAVLKRQKDQESTPPCHVCGHQSKSQRYLQIHMTQHDESLLIDCPHCDRRFSRKSLLNKHMQRWHARSDAGKPLEMKLAKRGDLATFFFKCLPCQLGFINRKTYVAHLNSFHPNIAHSSIPELNLPVRAYKHILCTLCPFKAAENELDKAQRHADECHNEEELRRTSNKRRYQSELMYNGYLKWGKMDMHFCEMCEDKTFDSPRYFLQHCKMEHPDYFKVLMPHLPLDTQFLPTVTRHKDEGS